MSTRHRRTVTASATAQLPARDHHLARLVRAAQRVQALLGLAVGAIGVHIADDNFFQPEPGTSAADHLVSGLVPLTFVLLAGVAVASNRLRAGGAAALALLLGYFGVVASTEAVYYAFAGGPSGDDYTGILSLLGGFLLLGAGTVMLWRTRRRNDSFLRRYLRRALIAAGALAVVAVVLFPTALAYVVTHTLRSTVPAADLGASYENVTFTTNDGLHLEGWFVPSRNGATVIVIPGRSGPQKHARMLIRHGYGVLLFDRRGEGASEGDPNLFGWVGDRDLHAAAAYLRSRPDVDPQRIGGIGLSVGGEMLIHAAAHSHAFRAIVSEGASGQSVRDGLANGDTRDALLGGGPNTLATAVFTNTLPPPSLKSEIPKIAPNAIFLVYGEKGQNGSETKPNKAFYAAAGEPKQIWEVPNGQHIAGITTRPQEYERRVVGFFDQVLLAKGETPR
jgi:fermentation-respiration switch protein FrsA (DUF1100 family)